VSPLSSGRFGLLADGRLPLHEQPLDTTAPSAPAPDIKQLFDAYFAHVWRLLRRFGVREAELDDAVQEVFRVVARRLADIRAGSERAFLYGVALRVASNLARRETLRPPTTGLDSVPEPGDERPSPEQQLEQHRARALLDEVLAALPLELRTVFVLAELEGLQVKEIAELEAIPLGTASSRLRRAREEFSLLVKRLRAKLDRHGGMR
jgi:RNA polymerase sigma-70 factor, ECF subfamily